MEFYEKNAILWLYGKEKDLGIVVASFFAFWFETVAPSQLVFNQ